MGCVQRRLHEGGGVRPRGELTRGEQRCWGGSVQRAAGTKAHGWTIGGHYSGRTPFGSCLKARTEQSLKPDAGPLCTLTGPVPRSLARGGLAVAAGGWWLSPTSSPQPLPGSFCQAEPSRRQGGPSLSQQHWGGATELGVGRQA